MRLTAQQTAAYRVFYLGSAPKGYISPAQFDGRDADGISYREHKKTLVEAGLIKRVGMSQYQVVRRVFDD